VKQARRRTLGVDAGGAQDTDHEHHREKAAYQSKQFVFHVFSPFVKSGWISSNLHTSYLESVMRL
jgi:hypothetical protein